MTIVDSSLMGATWQWTVLFILVLVVMGLYLTTILTPILPERHGCVTIVI